MALAEIPANRIDRAKCAMEVPLLCRHVAHDGLRGAGPVTKVTHIGSLAIEIRFNIKTDQRCSAKATIMVDRSAG
ncbi:MAG: hypothetical protein H0X53_07805 [Sphingomonas sp.]|nr:hypothetical protein [Sphingomonas sp.]